jgi:hypothetical protein
MNYKENQRDKQISLIKKTSILYGDKGNGKYLWRGQEQQKKEILTDPLNILHLKW